MARLELIPDSSSPLKGAGSVSRIEMTAVVPDDDDLTTVATPPGHEERRGVENEPKDLITELTNPEILASALPTYKKWVILTVIFLVQTSMNFNTSLYANGQSGMAKAFNVSRQTTVTGAAVFLITYAFGCELWAPWSEEIGRKIVLQCSLFLVNVCCLPVALAPQGMTSIIVGRAFGGLFSAGGSVTLGMVADMFSPDTQEYPLAFIVLSSVGGSIIGPIIGGFVETYLAWQWTIWLQLAFGLVVQFLHLILVPETRSTVRLDAYAKSLRKDRILPNASGPTEHKTWRQYVMPREILTIWIRPFHMFITEPIVSVLSALSGFSDALIFMQIQSFGLVFKLFNFTVIQTGLAFIPIGLGYVLAYLFYIPAIRQNRQLRRENPISEHAQYESRLMPLLYTAPCLPVGLFLFAWTSDASMPWALPMIGCLFIGIANYTIYMTTIDYMAAAYGPYSASATGGNGFARDFLAGLLTWFANPYYQAFHGRFALQIANTVLAGVSLLLVLATVVIYKMGPSMRRRSPFAQSLSTSLSGIHLTDSPVRTL
ncbi:major facilitator superfamily domain-containing protein [Xylaria bambusicola]|uniref:major facilitator superfamily domain-containing protein n=1 Tax=Xylaria bambusicola TaxID=326684 RepID=UPI002008526B|nr:major facilitator superfamily domain-containing protein [Xylaria bambusicola]KAI0521740.1 major facilitator superfamily domain-containing protein [Xylaria bambusicola]